MRVFPAKLKAIFLFPVRSSHCFYPTPSWPIEHTRVDKKKVEGEGEEKEEQRVQDAKGVCTEKVNSLMALGLPTVRAKI